jgi:hypothetical protein
VSRQVAILVALGAVAAAAALISFGSWILLRRGEPPSKGDEERSPQPSEPT